MPTLSPQGGWPSADGLPCCGCGADLNYSECVQVSFSDRNFMAFCGFKCLALWTHYFSGRFDEVRAWTALVEPRSVSH